MCPISFDFLSRWRCVIGDIESQLDSSLGNLEQSLNDIITLKPKKVELSDHIQFSITERSPPQSSRMDAVRDQTDDGDIISEGEQNWCILCPCTMMHMYKLIRRYRVCEKHTANAHISIATVFIVEQCKCRERERGRQAAPNFTPRQTECVKVAHTRLMFVIC